MPPEEKPYRLYRGGRVKGKVPAARPARPGVRRPRINLRPTRRWLRWIPALVGAFLLLVVVWALISYFQFRDGVSAANKRLSPRVGQMLDKQHGNATNILLLGTDHAQLSGRESANRSDSITLVRVDTSRHRIAYLSIPRDLRVNVPGHGYDKINSAFQLGGAALAIKTVRGFTDVEVNHVVVVDFDAFTKVIDKVGGVDINVPGPILSNKFDCPYATQARCDRWQGWRFAKGVQHMDGHRARVYSRIRENKLNPRETDVTRTERQQAVIQALLSKLTSVGVMAKLPFIGDDVMKPLTTDFSAGQMMQLAMVKKRSNNELHCRLGGTPAGFGGGYLQPDEEARRTIAAFLGNSAPQPPLPGSAFGSGCL